VENNTYQTEPVPIKLKDKKMNFTAENTEKNFFIVGGTDKKDI